VEDFLNLEGRNSVGYVTVGRWFVMTMRLSCTVMETWGPENYGVKNEQ